MKKIFYSGLGLVVIAVAFLVFNLLASLSLSNWRLDLTEQKLYTLSEGTQRILAELDDPIELQLFYSDKAAGNLPQLRNYATRVKEMLKAYERQAHGKLKVKLIDPEPFSEQEDQAARYGLQAVPLASGEQIYFGLVGLAGKVQEQVIPLFALDQEEYLEYQLSQLVQVLAKPEQPVVGVLSGLPINGGFDMIARRPQSPWMVMEEVRQLFQIRSLKAGIDQIPEEVSVLLLIHPKDLPEQSLYAIDQFVLRGGKLLAFVDPLSEADTEQPLMPGDQPSQDSDLPALFKAWGIEMLPEHVLLDGSYALSVGMGANQVPLRHLAWLGLPAAVINQQDMATSGLERINIATAGVLQPVAEATTHFEPLIQSSEYAMPVTAERFSMLSNPAELMRDFIPTGQRYTLAARISGPAQSAFPEGIESLKDGLTRADNIQVIVVADTDLLGDQMWVNVQDFFGQRVPQPFADNGSLLINALDNLSGSDALISIRTRGRFSRPFEVVEDLQRDAQAKFQAKEQALQQRLNETEEQLAQLQSSSIDGQDQLSSEQQASLQRFMAQKLQIRKELREVRFELNAQIEALGTRLKLLNIVLVPALLTAVVLLVWLWRRRIKA